MVKSYIITERGRGEYVEKHSKFIALAEAIQNDNDARGAISEMKRIHHSARHIPWALRLGFPDAQELFSDDGEPSGTAGRPILTAIKRAGFTDIVVVVARYFGGVKLGTGPLARAFQTAAELAIANANKKAVEQGVRVSITTPYKLVGSVQHILDGVGANIVEREFDTKTRLTALLPALRLDALKKKIDEIIPNGVEIIREELVECSEK